MRCTYPIASETLQGVHFNITCKQPAVLQIREPDAPQDVDRYCLACGTAWLARLDALAAQGNPFAVPQSDRDAIRQILAKARNL